MIEVAKRSILERIFQALKEAGITDLIVVTGYHANIIEDHLKDGSAFGLKIKYVRQEIIDGTGSATNLVEPYVSNDLFFSNVWRHYNRPIELYKISTCLSRYPLGCANSSVPSR